MRVAIVFAPLEVSRDFIDYPYFADLGAVQVAAVLREAGHEVVLADALALPGATLEPTTGDRIRLGASPRELLDAAPTDVDAFVVALSPFAVPPRRDRFLGEVLESLTKSSSAPVILADLHQGGQHVVDAPPDQVLVAYPEASLYLRHEAETSILELLADPEIEGARRAVSGTDPSPLDALPLPAWDLLDTAAYFRFHEEVVKKLGRGKWAFPIDGASLPALTSRGCPFRCAHCSSNPSARERGELLRPKIQRRHGRAWLDSLFGSLSARGARRVHLLDELANVSESHFDAVLDLAEAHDLALEIPNGLRADYVKTRQLARLKGRITTLSVSAESGVQRVVDEIVQKQLDLGEITRVAREANEAGVPVMVHYLIGSPGETRADVNGTLSFALDLFEETGAEPSVQFATPLPGTPLARAVEGRSIHLPVVDDWGPRFQKEPTFGTAELSAADLVRHKETFDRRMAASRGPKKIILNATYRCNNRCTFCATGTRTQLDGDFGRQREILVKYRKLGVTLLDIDGGEPTLNANLFNLVKFAKTVGYERINVTTNGRMASYEDFARKLATSGVTSILISIHGPDADTHAQNVGVKEAFDQTVAGIENLVRVAPAGVELGANVTLTKSNHEKLPELADLVVRLGLGWLNVQFLTPFGRATQWVAPDTQKAAEITMRTIDAFRGKLRVQVINLPFCFMPGYEENLVGDLLKLERHMIFVNNDEVNLFSYLRERRKKKPVCETCPHAIFCGGFFDLEDVPEPTWLVRPEDLVRPVKANVPERPRT
ncbi:MAG: radical SAM protein [Polyangiaceae bacterium]|nr:radical SAM protein [Polyangiaceae bacterium]